MYVMIMDIWTVLSKTSGEQLAKIILDGLYSYLSMSPYIIIYVIMLFITQRVYDNLNLNAP